MSFWDDLKGWFDPASGYQQAAQGAQTGANMAGQNATIQWNRQMQGLVPAMQQVNGYKSLYDQLYGTHTAQTDSQIRNSAGMDQPGDRGSRLGMLMQQAQGQQVPGSNTTSPRPNQMPAWMQGQGGPPPAQAPGGGGAPPGGMSPSLAALFSQR